MTALRSMTAFSRRESQIDGGNLAVELRSVNHRYVELFFRLPELFSQTEIGLRERIRSCIQRGKMDITVRFQNQVGAATEISISWPIVEQLLRANQKIATRFELAMPVNTFDILKWPGVLQNETTSLETLQTQLLRLFDEALNDLIAMREREGQALRSLLEERLKLLNEHAEKIQHLLPTAILRQREKLLSHFSAVKIELDPVRLEQEMVFFAQRCDVAEELDRINTHNKEIQRALSLGGVQGRRLDFLMQELHREANTLGSKSADSEITLLVVEMKILIDQMREQVQNIE